MNITLKRLFEAKHTIEKTLEQYWSETTRNEIEDRLRRINAAIERFSETALVGG
jgi:hypothetical protein